MSSGDDGAVAGPSTSSADEPFGEMWKHLWDASRILSSFVSANREMFFSRRVLELGAGGTGVPGLVAAKAGASRVFLTERRDYANALRELASNVSLNGLDEVVHVQALDWTNREELERFLDESGQNDHILGSDVFYDPSVFEGLVLAVKTILERNPKAQFWFAYEERDDSWSIGDVLEAHDLQAALVRRFFADRHHFQLGVIYRKDAVSSMPIFGGIEGGASFSKLILVDEAGHLKGEWKGEGTNYYLNGVEKTADAIATWVRAAKTEIGLVGPLASLGMGLSGAEDETMNGRLVQYLRDQHGDVAEDFRLESDSVCVIGATFEDGGAVIISGTGSSCRLLRRDGEVRGVGGWGHSIGDGGSGYWIANRAIRTVFDADDGLELAVASTERLKRLLLDFFQLQDKVEILDLLYGKFVKSKIASFTSLLAQNADDPVIAGVFHEAGSILGRHIRAIAAQADGDLAADLPVVAVGSVLIKSWPLLKQGFIDGLHDKRSAGSPILKRVRLVELPSTPAFGAAALAAKTKGVRLPRGESPKALDTIEL